jgi:hypothetical protein
MHIYVHSKIFPETYSGTLLNVTETHIQSYSNISNSHSYVKCVRICNYAARLCGNVQYGP